MDKGAPQPEFNPNLPAYSSSMGHQGSEPLPYGQPPMQAPPVNFIRATVFGPTSTLTYCLACNKNVQTNPILKSSGKTHLIALALCIFGCCLCIPCVYCSKSLRATNHYCPDCNTYLGSYSSI